MSWEYVKIDKIITETEKAFLVEIEGEQRWIPMSQIADPEEYRAGDADLEIAVTEWFAKKEGLGK